MSIEDIEKTVEKKYTAREKRKKKKMKVSGKSTFSIRNIIIKRGKKK